jgi:hypothetical protein
MIWIYGLVFKGATIASIITHCYSIQGITTCVVFCVVFGRGATYFLTMYTKQFLLNFFLNIAEIMDVPIKVAVRYSHRFFTIPPDIKTGTKDLKYLDADISEANGGPSIFVTLIKSLSNALKKQKNTSNL